MRVRAHWWIGMALAGSAVSASAMADGLGVFNPLGFYVGAGVGRSLIDQFQYDPYESYYKRLNDSPLGWNAFIGVRPIPFIGAELEYIDFGTAHTGAGPAFTNGGALHQFIDGSARNQAVAVFAVGYLPLPLPYMEPFVKLGAARIRDRENYFSVDNNALYENGSVVGPVYGESNNYRTGFAYGGGLQFQFQQLGIRAQYEKITTSHFGLDYNPSLVSAAVTWTF